MFSKDYKPIEKKEKEKKIERLSISDKIMSKGLELNLKNYFFESFGEIQSGAVEGRKINEVRNKKIIDIDKDSELLIKKVQNINKEAEYIKDLQTVPFSDLTKSQRKTIINFNSDDFQLTKQEELKIKNLGDRQEKWSQERKRIIESEDSTSFLYNIGKSGGEMGARGTDTNLENDTIASRTLGAFINAGEKISNLEPNIYESAKNEYSNYINTVQKANDEYDRDMKLMAETGNLTYMASVGANLDRFKKSFIGGDYLAAVGHHAEIGYNKLASGFASDSNLTGNDRTSRITAGLIEIPMSVINGVFDEEVTGQYGQAGGSLMTAAFEPVMATISEVTQQMGSSRETADNWAFVTTAALPFVRFKKRGQYLTEQTKFFTEIKDVNIQKMYIKNMDLSNKIRKIEVEFQNKEYIGAEKIKSPDVKKAITNNIFQKIVSDKNIPKKEKIRILEKLNNETKLDYLKLKKQKKEVFKTKVGNLFDITASKFGTRNNFIKENLIKDTDIKLKDINTNTKIDNFIESIISKASNTLITKTANISKRTSDGKYINKKELNKIKIQVEIDAITKQVDKLGLDITPITRKKIVQNTLDLVHQKQLAIKSTVKELWKYQQKKIDFNETAKELKWTKEEKIQYAKEWEIKDSSEFSRKYDGIKLLEKEGIIEFTDIDSTGNRMYKISDGMESLFNGKKGGIFHYPEYLYKTKELSNRLDNMKKKAENGCL